MEPQDLTELVALYSLDVLRADDYPEILCPEVLCPDINRPDLAAELAAFQATMAVLGL